ncbi:MAG: alkaline phosphatase D family protein, partial [Pseudomonadota bacterium]
MRLVAFALAVLLLAHAARADGVLPADTLLTRVAFGSCGKEDKPQPIWDAVLAARPQAFVFLGDNIYGDTRDPAVLAAKYARLGAIEGFARLRAQVPLFATWDDHDYGENDAGAEYPMKEASRAAFLRFWGEPADSPRVRRDGIYDARVFGPPGKRVQLILLDLRWNRTPITVDPRWGTYEAYERWARREARRAQDAPMPGPDARDPERAACGLGEAGWAWLGALLRG